ncbi:MAG: TetR/AcrR family transcriptional regulator [Gemmatimonadota bacterium]
MSVATLLQTLVASARASGARARKGDVTRAAIVEAALAIARRAGLEALTIGALAEQMRMSKSGVFAHFGAREELQLAVLKEYAVRFVGEVLRPAVRRPRGLPRLQAILDNWLSLLAREVEQGCLMIGGASEYDDRPGPLQDAMVAIIGGWRDELTRAITAAKDNGDLREDTDPRQLAFEIYGVMLAFHQSARLLRAADSYKRARAALARLLRDAAAHPSPLKPNRAPRRPKPNSPTRSAQVQVRRAASRTRRT